jgi:hypothetical protein
VTRAAAIAFLLLAACGQGAERDPVKVWQSGGKSAAAKEDSARIVHQAMRALRGDTLRLRVDALTRGSEGWLVRLLPNGGGTAGGGEVWVERDSSVTVVKRY